MATNGNRWHSNTTLVKVKWEQAVMISTSTPNSNTTLVKVKSITEHGTMASIIFKYNTC